MEGGDRLPESQAPQRQRSYRMNRVRFHLQHWCPQGFPTRLWERHACSFTFMEMFKLSSVGLSVVRSVCVWRGEPPEFSEEVPQSPQTRVPVGRVTSQRFKYRASVPHSTWVSLTPHRDWLGGPPLNPHREWLGDPPLNSLQGLVR